MGEIDRIGFEKMLRPCGGGKESYRVRYESVLEAWMERSERVIL